MTFINFVRFARHQEIFSETAQGSMYLLYLSQCWQRLNKFCKSVTEIFGDEVLRVINTVKNISLSLKTRNAIKSGFQCTTFFLADFVFTSECPHYSRALYSTFISTCRTQQKIHLHFISEFRLFS